MLDRLQGEQFFTKLDLQDAYHRIRIREGDEWKTAFRTRLFAKLSKCSFETTSVSFLGFIVDTEEVRMDPERVQTIDEWPVPRSFKEIQIFLGFTNFYRHFIFRYSVLTAPIMDLLKGMQNGKKTGPFLFTQEASKAFQELKQAFRREPLLRYFDPEKPIRLEMDVSLFAAGAVLSQPWDDGDGNGK
ncbi:hypothetical protein VTO42DRAFT_2763 [Malbranchea cinnamomea]